ncbi:hypothetical protein P7C70_g2818, partial [Phenoliferia sp. Uapishka_3]
MPSDSLNPQAAIPAQPLTPRQSLSDDVERGSASNSMPPPTAIIRLQNLCDERKYVLLVDATLTFTFFALWTARRAYRFLSAVQAALLCSMIPTIPGSAKKAEIAALICTEAQKALKAGVAFAPVFRVPFPLVLLAFVLTKAILAYRFVHSSKKDSLELACHLMLTSVTLHLAVGSVLLFLPSLPDINAGNWKAVEAYAMDLATRMLPGVLIAGGFAMLGLAAWQSWGKDGRWGLEDADKPEDSKLDVKLIDDGM